MKRGFNMCRSSKRTIFSFVCLLCLVFVISCGEDGLEGMADLSVDDLPAEARFVRVTISGEDMTTMSETFSAITGSGEISGIPPGENRLFTIEALDESNRVTHRTEISGVSIRAGETVRLQVSSWDVV